MSLSFGSLPKTAGKVTRSYTRWIRHRDPSGRCLAADDLPAEGTYDGKRLVLKIQGSRNSPICNDHTLTFFRGKEHYFHRWARTEVGPCILTRSNRAFAPPRDA